MNIDITRLKNSIVPSVEINEILNFPKEDIENAEMLDLRDVMVSGSITKTSLDDYNINLRVRGKMILSCAVTLKPVDYPFTIDIDEVFSENAEEITKKIKKCENTIDILPIVWENILMEIPMRVISPNASLEKIEGDGWKLVTEDSDDINPELAKLKDLLK